LAAAVCALAAASCYSTSYRKEVVANTTLLSELADKLSDYCRSDFRLDGRQVSSEEMGEFDYALRKARSWAAMIEPAATGRASYRDFAELIAAYEKFARDAEEYRLSHAQGDPARLAALMREHDEVARRARLVLAALRDERD
jgi:hypothetical protein